MHELGSTRVRNQEQIVSRGWRLNSLIPFLGAVLSLVAGGQVMAQTHIGHYEQADIAYGSSLYSTYCVVCHGVTGDMLPNVNLRSGRFRHAASDRDLRGLIRDGIPGTASDRDRSRCLRGLSSGRSFRATASECYRCDANRSHPEPGTGSAWLRVRDQSIRSGRHGGRYRDRWSSPQRGYLFRATH